MCQAERENRLLTQVTHMQDICSYKPIARRVEKVITIISTFACLILLS